MKKIIALLLALVMVFALVACAAKTDAPAEETKTEEPAATETTTTEETTEPAAEETAEPAAEEGKVYNVAYLVNGNLGDKSFFDSAESGLEELEAAGRIELTTIEMGGTDEDQPTWLSTLYDVSGRRRLRPHRLRHLSDARLPEGSCDAVSRPAVRHL